MCAGKDWVHGGCAWCVLWRLQDGTLIVIGPDCKPAGAHICSNRMTRSSRHLILSIGCHRALHSRSARLHSARRRRYTDRQTDRHQRESACLRASVGAAFCFHVAPQLSSLWFRIGSYACVLSTLVSFACVTLKDPGIIRLVCAHEARAHEGVCVSDCV